VEIYKGDAFLRKVEAVIRKNLLPVHCPLLSDFR
jgi:hypothetical protein